MPSRKKQHAPLGLNEMVGSANSEGVALGYCRLDLRPKEIGERSNPANQAFAKRPHEIAKSFKVVLVVSLWLRNLIGRRAP